MEVKKTKKKLQRGGMRKLIKTCSLKRGWCNTMRKNGDIEEGEIILMNYLSSKENKRYLLSITRNLGYDFI